MKNNFVNPFEHNIPQLDLHGMTKEIARVYIKDFINDNYKLKNKKIVIIHGFGSGILRKTTNELLAKDKRILNYGIDYLNGGSTIVELNVI